MGAGDQQALADRLHLGSLCAHTRGASQSQHTDAQAINVGRSMGAAVWRGQLWTPHAIYHTHTR